MTPAEQGQVWTIFNDQQLGGVRAEGPLVDGPTKVVPASELEIAQRFCDEVVDELARVREEQGKAADDLSDLSRLLPDDSQALALCERALAALDQSGKP